MTTIYRTCNSDQLECLTEQGWVIDQTQHEAEALRDKLDSTDRLRLELAAKVNELNTRLAATGKMERDIAKLRAALGDLRMREILDGE